MTTDRSDYVEFLWQIHTDIQTLIMQRPKGSAMNMWAYVNIFSNASWLAVFVTVLGIAFVIRFCTGILNSGLFDNEGIEKKASTAA